MRWMPTWAPSSPSPSARAARALCECYSSGGAQLPRHEKQAAHGFTLKSQPLGCGVCMPAVARRLAEVGGLFSSPLLQLCWSDCVIPYHLSRRFECKSDGQYFVVQHVALEPTSGDVEESAYTGPVRLAEEGQEAANRWHSKLAAVYPGRWRAAFHHQHFHWLCRNVLGPIASRCTRSWMRSCRSTLRNTWLRWVGCVSRHVGGRGPGRQSKRGGIALLANIEQQVSPAAAAWLFWHVHIMPGGPPACLQRGVDAELGAYLLPLIHDKEQR